MQTRLPYRFGGPGAERTRGPAPTGGERSAALPESLAGRTASRHCPTRGASPRVAAPAQGKQRGRMRVFPCGRALPGPSPARHGTGLPASRRARCGPPPSQCRAEVITHAQAGRRGPGRERAVGGWPLRRRPAGRPPPLRPRGCPEVGAVRADRRQADRHGPLCPRRVSRPLKLLPASLGPARLRPGGGRCASPSRTRSRTVRPNAGLCTARLKNNFA